MAPHASTAVPATPATTTNADVRDLLRRIDASEHGGDDVVLTELQHIAVKLSALAGATYASERITPVMDFRVYDAFANVVKQYNRLIDRA